MPEGLDQLLRDRSRASVPEPAVEALQPGLQLFAVVAEPHVGAPAAEARLDDRREVEVGERRLSLDQGRPWMRQPGAAEDARGEQLVVREDERVWPVEDANAGLLEPFERPEPVLDAVERAAHVEPRERDVATAERQQRFARGEHLARDPIPARRGEREVRGARAVRDDGETHPLSTLRRISEPWAAIR